MIFSLSLWQADNRKVDVARSPKADLVHVHIAGGSLSMLTAQARELSAKLAAALDEPDTASTKDHDVKTVQCGRCAGIGSVLNPERLAIVCLRCSGSGQDPQ